MLHLFNDDEIVLNLPDAEFIYYPNFFNTETANLLFQKLVTETNWQQDSITIFNKKQLQPRLTSFHSVVEKNYTYSNLTMQSNPFQETLYFIKNKIEEKTKETFNSVLLNLYRNEKDSNGWHADNEKELGKNPIIASLSLGEERIFQLKHTSKKHIKQSFSLENGSLLLMKNNSQIHYKHQIPKSLQPKKPRINLTFREIL